MKTNQTPFLAFLAVCSLVTSPAARADGVIPIKEVFEPQGSFDPKIYGKVAVVQWNQNIPTPVDVSKEVAEDFKRKNREEVTGYIRTAAQKGAKLVITPEFGIVGYPSFPPGPPEDDMFRNRADIAPYVEPVPGT